jgi:mannose-6-phosphate isomerase-like protein (cupin superfamily)
MREPEGPHPEEPRMSPRLPILVALAAIGLAAGARAVAADAAGASPPAPVVDALLGSQRRTVTFESLLAEPLPAGETFRVREIGRDDHTSQHFVWVRDAEEPHRHDSHDLVVVLLRGFGSMRIGDEEREVGPGSILYVPRGTVHAFRNTSGAPAASYVIYTPPFDGKDRQPAGAPR